MPAAVKLSNGAMEQVLIEGGPFFAAVRENAKELEAAVDAFVSGLSETERRIFIARYWFLLSVKEIADRLGCTQSKVKTSLFRTRNKLRLYLQEEELC